MDDKKSFVLYADLKNIVDKLPDEMSGKLFKLILDYVNGIENVINDLLLSVMFESIKSQLDRDNEKWKEIRSKRSKAGKASANKRQQMPTHVKTVEQNITHVESCSTNSTVTVPVTVNVNDSVNISPIIPLEEIDPKAELQKMKELSEGSFQIWQMLAKEQEVEFTEEEWGALRGLAMANPRLQPFQITSMIIQLHDWAYEGLDIKKSIVDYNQKKSSPYNSLKQPFMTKLTDAKGNPIYGAAIVEHRNRIIEQEKGGEK